MYVCSLNTFIPDGIVTSLIQIYTKAVFTIKGSLENIVVLTKAF